MAKIRSVSRYLALAALAVTPPAVLLFLAGTAQAGYCPDLACTSSDRRLKRDIRPI